MSFYHLLIVTLAYISAVSCAFEIKCSSRSSASVLSSLEADARTMLKNVHLIWECGQKYVNDSTFGLEYRICIDSHKEKFPSSYFYYFKYSSRGDFSTYESFKAEVKRIGERCCNESQYTKIYTSVVTGGSFEGESNATIYITIGVVVIIICTIVAVIIYRNKKAKEEEATTNNSAIPAYPNNSYPPMAPNAGTYPPYQQYPQTFAPAAGPNVAPNSFVTPQPTHYPQSLDK